VDKEKRQYFRIDTEIPVTVHLPDGEILPAVIVNLSVGGLKFSCGRDTVHQILPKDQRTPGQIMGVMIEIQFDLQSSAQPRVSLNAMARVIHSERLAQDVFHVGVQFIRIEEADLAALKSYIDANLPQQLA
jgi:c-di-GMP-binding flagellar brake protein YcgR